MCYYKEQLKETPFHIDHHIDPESERYQLTCAVSVHVKDSDLNEKILIVEGDSETMNGSGICNLFVHISYCSIQNPQLVGQHDCRGSAADIQTYSTEALVSPRPSCLQIYSIRTNKLSGIDCFDPLVDFLLHTSLLLRLLPFCGSPYRCLQIFPRYHVK